MRLTAGTFSRLGANWDGRGTNFALFSAHAQKVELCLFDNQGRRELERVELPERTEDVWHGYLNDVSPGQLYGYRVHGPYAPEHGHRFNPNKLLIDPYAKRLAGRLVWSDAHFAHRIGSPREDLSFDRRDNARGMPKAVVIDETFNWGRRETRPSIPWEDTIIYEAHIKGVTQMRKDVPPNLRGTYGGLSSPTMIAHLKKLGVTTVELLPVHGFVDDRILPHGLLDVLDAHDRTGDGARLRRIRLLQHRFDFLAASLLQDVAKKKVVTPSQQRAAADYIRETYGISQRRAGQTLGRARRAHDRQPERSRLQQLVLDAAARDERHHRDRVPAHGASKVGQVGDQRDARNSRETAHGL